MNNDEFKKLLNTDRFKDIKLKMPTIVNHSFGDMVNTEEMNRQIQEMDAENERKEKLAEEKERRERRNFWINIFATGISLTVAIIALIRTW